MGILDGLVELLSQIGVSTLDKKIEITINENEKADTLIELVERLNRGEVVKLEKVIKEIPIKKDEESVENDEEYMDEEDEDPMDIVPKELVERVEKALNIKLRDKQKQYITGNRNIEWERGEGRTVSHCIRLALVMSKDDIHVVLDMTRPQEFSDRYFDIRYSRYYYRDLFFRIWKRLKAGGLPVVKLKYNGKYL